MATAITNSFEKFLHELGDIYDAEHRFLKGQQEMLNVASDTQLKSMIQEHMQQSQQQIQNLDRVFAEMGLQPKAVTCDAAMGLVTEAQKTVQEAADQSVRDCLIDGALDKVEHYEIASYRGLLTGAKYLGQQQLNAQNISQLLQQNLQQEEQTAQKLEQTAPQLLQKAMQKEGAAATSGQ